ncbi:MAG: hypothetical protein Q9213_001717 [Squamulea squamosa]
MPEPPIFPLMPSLISIPADYGKTIPSRGRSTSPIRPGSSAKKLRKPPSRTFIPLALPIDIIDFPQILHSRINIAIDLSSPVLMGGATAEGVVHLTVDGGLKKAKASTKLATMSINRITVSLVGIERSGARQHMFRCLMTDLIDEAHPPPVEMARPDQPISDRLWEVTQSSTTLPFRLDLPIMLGPPPYSSRKNSIIYLVSVLVEVKIAGERSYVRESQEATVLTVHDPEKALLNLPNPLVVTEEIQTSHNGTIKTVELTAGVHRQTWISGYPLFVDVRIVNRGSKILKKVDLQLERLTFIYAHTAPSDEHGLGETLRLPDRCEKELILKFNCSGWQILPHSHGLKTCSLPIPSGLVSIDADATLPWVPAHQLAGRFFGVRFFLNIRVNVAFFKHLTVQLPITLIHPVSITFLVLNGGIDSHTQNSIDIPPNSLAQVAATIEHKHRDRHSLTPDIAYSYRPGQAFVAARRQSFEQAARNTMPLEEINSIANALNEPGKPKPQQARRRASETHITANSKTENPRLAYRNSRFLEGTNSFRNPPTSQQGPPPIRPPVIRNHPLTQRPDIPQRKTHRASLEERSSNQPLLGNQPVAVQHRRTRTLEDRQYRGPRLQRSTSGLKFSSSEDEDELGYEGVGDPFVDTRARLKRRTATEKNDTDLSPTFFFAKDPPLDLFLPLTTCTDTGLWSWVLELRFRSLDPSPKRREGILRRSDCWADGNGDVCGGGEEEVVEESGEDGVFASVVGVELDGVGGVGGGLDIHFGRGRGGGEGDGYGDGSAGFSWGASDGGVGGSFIVEDGDGVADEARNSRSKAQYLHVGGEYALEVSAPLQHRRQHPDLRSASSTAARAAGAVHGKLNLSADADAKGMPQTPQTPQARVTGADCGGGVASTETASGGGGGFPAERVEVVDGAAGSDCCWVGTVGEGVEHVEVTAGPERWVGVAMHTAGRWMGMEGLEMGCQKALSAEQSNGATRRESISTTQSKLNVSNAQCKQGGHGVTQDGSVGAIELGDSSQEEGERNVFKEVIVATTCKEERIRVLMVAGVVLLLGIERVANPLFVLDALINDAIVEQQEIGGEWQGPGASDSCVRISDCDENGLGFEEVILKGLASDGGLFIPEQIPSIPQDWGQAWLNWSFQELAFRIFSLYISASEVSSGDLRNIIEKSYASFRSSDVTPLVTLDRDKQLHLLELFHGPTFAFKDVALQFLGFLLEYFLVRRNKDKADDQREHLTVIGATSGDTGSAAIYGLRKKHDLSIMIMFPKGKVSPIQEAQMTTVTDDNVHNVAIDGTFDDCQDFVKALFGDSDINGSHKLAAVNSINWARILAQITYYFFAYSTLVKSEEFREGDKVRFVTPTGNFGNVLAGYFAKRMGLPIDKLVISTNENDILHRFWQSGYYEKKPVHGHETNGDFAEAKAYAHPEMVRETLSPAMDILVSSNFERLLWFLALHVYGEGNLEEQRQIAGKRVKSWLEELKSSGGFGVEPSILEAARIDFESERVSDKETVSTIKSIYSAQCPAATSSKSTRGTASNGGYILDPHSAVGVAAAKRSINRVPPSRTHHIALATAHPAKFSNAVEMALKEEPGFEFKNVLPEQFIGLDELPRKVTDVKKSDGLEGLKKFIRQSVPASKRHV